jgi:hypothetical protein
MTPRYLTTPHLHRQERRLILDYVKQLIAEGNFKKAGQLFNEVFPT